MQTEKLQNCPQCKGLIEGNAKRIIKDSCGHAKCRVCLLLDVEGCRQCLINDSNKLVDNVENDEHLPEDNHYTTVITSTNMCNNIPKDILSTVPENSHDHEEAETKINLKSSLKKRTGKISTHKKMKHLSIKRDYKIIPIPSHITVEGKPPIFNCTVCNSKFITKVHVKYHQFCSGEKKPYECDICHKSYIFKSQLQVHQLLHTGNRPHICIVCNKSFREMRKLKRHMTLHCEDRPHICDECGKTFKTQNYLNMHRIIHTGEKPFSCNYCNMKFYNSSNLKKHLISHSDDKTHMCEQCGKKFKQKYALTVHRKSHMHIRDFVCKQCDRAFTNNKDLKRHESIHLEIKMYSCGLCKMSFRRKDNLGRHIKTAHPDKKPEIIKNILEISENSGKPVVDNPNAINVITASPMAKQHNTNTESIPLTRTCINGPLKLAFKTSAFKRNYNINRECNFDSNSKGDSHLYLNKSSKAQSEDVVKTPTLDIVQAKKNSTPRIFPSVYSSPNLSVDEFYANRPHVIKNIKFKIPENYPSKNEGLLKTIIPPMQISPATKEKDDLASKSIVSSINNSNLQTKNRPINLSSPVCHNLENSPVAATSVIVNSSNSNNMHWRRRMSQNVASENGKL
ncbi:hypothetical protein WA026_004032 [Henosepilachna vigintioctopunctata]|uniref:C2H2-type domain-containing protein n=1 Tax=Henosepilachna vigintioctopunctata TaxID=420089 RepID=A0AAW1U8E0_9CUCU